MKCSHGQPDPTESTKSPLCSTLKGRGFSGTWICRECGKERCDACGTFKRTQFCGLRCLTAGATRVATTKASNTLKALSGAIARGAKNKAVYLRKLCLFYLKKVEALIKSLAFFLAAVTLGALSVTTTYSKGFRGSLRSAGIITERILAKVTSKSIRAVALIIVTVFKAKLSLIKSTLRLKLSIILQGVSIVFHGVSIIERLSGRLYLICARLYDYGGLALKVIVRASAATAALTADVLAVLSHIVASPIYLAIIIYGILLLYAHRARRVAVAFTGDMLYAAGDVLIGFIIFHVELVRFLGRATALSGKTLFVALHWSLSLMIAIVARLTALVTDELLKFTTCVGAVTVYLLSTAAFLIRDVTMGSMAFSVGLVFFLKALILLALSTAATVLIWTTGTSAAVVQALYVSLTGTIHTLLFASTVSFEWIVKLIALTIKAYLFTTSAALRGTLKAIGDFIRELPLRTRREARSLRGSFIDILRVRKELPIAVALLLSVISLSLVHMQVGSGMSPERFVEELQMHLSEKNAKLKATITTTIRALPSSGDNKEVVDIAKTTTPESAKVALLTTTRITPSTTKEVLPNTAPRPKAALKTVAKATAVEKDKEVKLASIAPKTLHIPRPALRTDPALLRLTPPDITRGSTDSMKISITFDGGSNATETALILKTLKEKGIKTTIFLAGSFIKKYPALVRRMVRDGHEIGNHTMSHPHLTTYGKDRRHRTLKGFTKSALREELESAAELFRGATGREMAPLWRAPYGEVNSELRRWAFDIGYIHIGWTTDRKRKESLDTLDWVSDEGSKLYLTSREIRDRILNFGKGSKDGLSGGIVLMHLGTERTKKEQASLRLNEMIDKLRRRGYSFVKISDLLPDIKKIRPFLTTAQKVAMNEPLLPALPSMPLTLTP